MTYWQTDLHNNITDLAINTNAQKFYLNVEKSLLSHF